MKVLIVLLQKILVVVGNIKVNLKMLMLLSYVNFGVVVFNGFVDYYSGDVVKVFVGVKDVVLQKQLVDVVKVVLIVMWDLGMWIEGQCVIVM